MDNREKLEIPTIEFTHVVTLLSANSTCATDDPEAIGTDAQVGKNEQVGGN